MVQSWRKSKIITACRENSWIQNRGIALITKKSIIVCLTYSLIISFSKLINGFSLWAPQIHLILKWSHPCRKLFHLWLNNIIINSLRMGLLSSFLGHDLNIFRYTFLILFTFSLHSWHWKLVFNELNYKSSGYYICVYTFTTCIDKTYCRLDSLSICNDV